ncbi:MAG TPA: hypothetical protein VI685_11490 [Candidatus Angelobacter sp.]
MSAPLRPLTTGELLDRTFHLYRNNFFLFAGIATVAALSVVGASLLLMVLGISLPAPGPNADPRAFLPQFATYFGIWGLFYLLGATLATGATIYAVSKVHLGQVTSISESYGRVFPRMGRLILIALAIILRVVLLAVILFLCLFVVILLLGLIFARMGSSSDRDFIVGYVFGLLAVLTLYVLLIRLYLRYSLAVQACVLENTGTNDSMKRSAFLTLGSLWRIFLIYLLMGVIGIALSFALQSPAELLFRTGSLLALIWQFLATFVAYTLSFPISNIAISLVYYDQRVRKEAFDLQLMMESLGQDSSQAAAAPVG